MSAAGRQIDAAGGKIALVLVLLAIIGATLWLQLKTYPNHDVAWVLWGTREMLHGARWGSDIIEANPPLAWYLAMPTTALAEWLHLPLDWTFRAAVAGAAAISAASWFWLAPRNQSYGRSLALCTTAGAVLLLLPGREFGQREHLLLIAVLPYLALCALRLDGESRPSTSARVVIGAVAGVGVALKPYFIGIPVLAELALQLLARPRPRLLRAENLAGAAVIALYALWVLAFERTYVREVIPLANEIYWEYDLPFAAIIKPLLAQLVAAAPLAFIALWKRDRLGIMVAGAWCGFAASYIVQHKGYPYHMLPVTSATVLLAAAVATSPSVRQPLRWAAAILMAAVVALSLPTLAAWWGINKPGGARSVQIDRVLASLSSHAPNGRWLVVAVHHYPAFPTAIYTPVRYVSRTNSQWFLSAVAQIHAGQARPANAASIERHAHEFILHDLRREPDLVLIDTDSGRHTIAPKNFDFLAFFQEDPEFRAEWRFYREIERIGPFRQFVRLKRTPIVGRTGNRSAISADAAR